MPQKRYEIGVIGCGKIWDIGHWKGLQEIPDDARVRYVHDVDPARARAAAEATGATALDDPAPLFDDAAVDIVAICTPPFARVDYVRRACAAGKHLMLEKPMARTLDQALDIRRCIRQAGIKCFVPFMRALSAGHRALAEQISSGAFGQPLAFVHTFLGTPYPWVPLDHWMHDRERSGGPIFDYSIHFIEMARACLGAEADTALYAGAANTGRVASDDHATLVVHYQGGPIGQFTKSWNFPPGVRYGHNATHVVCRDAVIVLGQPTLIHTPDGVREHAAPEGGRHGRAEAYLNLIDAIENDAPLHAAELHGLRTNEILDAMERSRASGAAERVALHE